MHNDFPKQLERLRNHVAPVAEITRAIETTNQEDRIMEINKHIELLGLKAEDVVTGFKGVITTLSFDLYGCIQVVISPGLNKEGQIETGQWFDVTRLKIKSKKPVMEVPDFQLGYVAEGYKGAADKPLP